jgi:hypothetical protein
VEAGAAGCGAWAYARPAPARTAKHSNAAPIMDGSEGLIEVTRHLLNAIADTLYGTWWGRSMRHAHRQFRRFPNSPSTMPTAPHQNFTAVVTQAVTRAAGAACAGELGWGSGAPCSMTGPLMQQIDRTALLPMRRLVAQRATPPTPDAHQLRMCA